MLGMGILWNHEIRSSHVLITAAGVRRHVSEAEVPKPVPPGLTQHRKTSQDLVQKQIEMQDLPLDPSSSSSSSLMINLPSDVTLKP